MTRVGTTRWIRCSLAGLAAFAGAFALTAGVVFVYAFRLAFEVRGAPDPAKIQAFARAVAPMWGPWLRVIIVLAIAFWLGRNTKSAVLEGVVVGLVAAIAGLWLAWPPDARGLAFFVGTIVAAVIGALLARRRPA
jgi:ABC-type antimicrobial peptide transport system permease subunit